MRMLAINLFHFPHCLACMLVCLLVVSGWSEGRGVSPYNIIKKTMKVHTPILHYLSSMMLLGGAQVSDERSICVESIQIAKKKENDKAGLHVPTVSADGRSPRTCTWRSSKT